MDRQTDRHGNLELCPFETCHTESATNYCNSCESPCHIGIHNIISVNTAFPKEITACGKEAELDNSSHPYCTPCPHHTLAISAQKK